MTHFLVWSLVLHICLELDDEWLGATVVAMGAESVLDEDAGPWMWQKLLNYHWYWMKS